ncbi:MAG: glycosyltransferase [Blastocatellia bacterium]|nr:glycosyltransferase [Blastocatellia bacterium]
MIDNFWAAGSERQAAQLTRSLIENSRYEVFMACMKAEGNLGQELREIGLTEIPSFPLKTFYHPSTAAQLNRFARLLRKLRIDIVHTHDLYTNIFGITGAWMARVPVRIASRRDTTGCRTPSQELIERQVYKLSHSIVVNADMVRKHLVSLGHQGERIETIYNSFVPERVRSRHTREDIFRLLKLPAENGLQFITIVANMHKPVKDHVSFLRAAQQIRQAVPNARFALAGDGQLREELRGFAKELGLEKEALFLGSCENVAELLSISDVCVLSSLAEGFSNSILEYMGAERPVVATRVGGAAEAIVEGETGFLVPPAQPDLLAARVIELLRDPERANEMGRRGRRIVEQKFTPQAQLDKTERLYDRLLNRAGSAALQTQKVMGNGMLLALPGLIESLMQ